MSKDMNEQFIELKNQKNQLMYQKMLSFIKLMKCKIQHQKKPLTHFIAKKKKKSAIVSFWGKYSRMAIRIITFLKHNLALFIKIKMACTVYDTHCNTVRIKDNLDVENEHRYGFRYLLLHPKLNASKQLCYFSQFYRLAEQGFFLLVSPLVPLWVHSAKESAGLADPEESTFMSVGRCSPLGSLGSLLRDLSSSYKLDQLPYMGFAGNHPLKVS